MPNSDSSESNYDMSSNDEECSNDFETDSGDYEYIILFGISLLSRCKIKIKMK